MVVEEVKRTLKPGRYVLFSNGVLGKDKENYTWVLAKDKYYRIVSFRILEDESPYNDSIKIEAYIIVKSSVRKCVFNSSVIKEISKFPPIPESYKSKLAAELFSIQV
jgi:hypothetical protein